MVGSWGRLAVINIDTFSSIAKRVRHRTLTPVFIGSNPIRAVEPILIGSCRSFFHKVIIW